MTLGSEGEVCYQSGPVAALVAPTDEDKQPDCGHDEAEERHEHHIACRVAHHCSGGQQAPHKTPKHLPKTHTKHMINMYGPHTHTVHTVSYSSRIFSFVLCLLLPQTHPLNKVDCYSLQRNILFHTSVTSMTHYNNMVSKDKLLQISGNWFLEAQLISEVNNTSFVV